MLLPEHIHAFPHKEAFQGTTTMLSLDGHEGRKTVALFTPAKGETIAITETTHEPGTRVHSTRIHPQRSYTLEAQYTPENTLHRLRIRHLSLVVPRLLPSGLTIAHTHSVSMTIDETQGIQDAMIQIGGKTEKLTLPDDKIAVPLWQSVLIQPNATASDAFMLQPYGDTKESLHIGLYSPLPNHEHISLSLVLPMILPSSFTDAHEIGARLLGPMGR